MNIEYINAIPLCKIFDKLKLKPVQESDLHSLYPSPFQKETTHTIEVSHETNNWYDGSIQKCGGPLELITGWLRYQGLHCSIPDAVKWFRFNIGYPSMQDGITPPDEKQPDVKFAFKSPILNPALISLSTGKGIPLTLARKHLHQVGLTNMETGAEFLALGLKTEEGDWWVHSPYVSTFIGTTSITYIPGSKYSFRAVHIFKDVFDYMAAKMRINGGKPFEDECIILNSYECLENSAAYIRGFGYETLYSWLGTDPNGRQATKNYALLCSIEDNLRHEPMSF